MVVFTLKSFAEVKLCLPSDASSILLTHTHLHAHTHTYTHAHMHLQIRTLTCTHVHVHTHTRTRTHTHTYMYIHTHAHPSPLTSTTYPPTPPYYSLNPVTLPPSFPRHRSYENTQMGGGYLYASRKKEILSPVPETTGGGARVVEISVPPGSMSPSQYPPHRKWSAPAPNTRSMENMVTRGTGTPPSRRRGPGGRSYEPHLPNGRPPHYRSVCGGLIMSRWDQSPD